MSETSENETPEKTELPNASRTDHIPEVFRSQKIVLFSMGLLAPGHVNLLDPTSGRPHIEAGSRGILRGSPTRSILPYRMVFAGANHETSDLHGTKGLLIESFRVDGRELLVQTDKPVPVDVFESLATDPWVRFIRHVREFIGGEGSRWEMTVSNPTPHRACLVNVAFVGVVPNETQRRRLAPQIKPKGLSKEDAPAA